MAKLTNKRIPIGGEVRNVWQDDNGDLWIKHPVSKNKTIIGSIYDEGVSAEESPREPDALFDWAHLGEGLGEGSILGSLIGGASRVASKISPDKAHDVINELIKVNDLEIKKQGIIRSLSLKHEYERLPSRKLSGLDALGERLASMLIGQDPETGEIPHR